MNDETIQSDVSDQAALDAADSEALSEVEQGLEAASDPISKREAKMAALGEARRAEQEEGRKAAALINNPDLSEEDYDDAQQESSPLEAAAGNEDIDPTSLAGDPEAEGAKADATPATPQSGWRENAAGDRVKTLMVNGEAREFTEAQYDRMLQKDLAGDQKLRLAAENESRLAERARELEARELRLAEAGKQPPPGVASEQLEQKIAQHTELLLEGDTDAANKMMAEIISLGRDSSTPNIDDLANQVATRVAANAEQKNHNESVQAGWETFQSDYKDVMADPDALAFADIQVKNIRAAEPELSPKDVILKAGQITREKLHLSGGDYAQEAGKTPDELKAARMERKSKLKPMPKVGGKPRPASVEPEVDNSAEGKIARMRQARAL